MSRSDYYWFGDDFLIFQPAAAKADPNNNDAVMKFNAPGGRADSAPMFAQAIAEFKKVKPIAAATAYCARAVCGEIVMEDSATSDIGSIGSLLKAAALCG